MALYLTEDEVGQVLTMADALSAVEQAHRWHAVGDATDTPRARSRTPSSALHILHGAVMPLGIMGYKSYTTSREAARFWLHLFDAGSGRPLAVLEANLLGMMRTGAAGGLAARMLSRESSRVAGVFGAGWQARSQIEALCAVRDLDEIQVFSRRRDRLEAFCAEQTARLGRVVRAADSAEAMVKASDVVVTITTASEPLFDGRWLQPGTHVTAAGSNALIRREIDETTIRRAAVVAVDGRANALRESGDLLPVLEKGRLNDYTMVELGELLGGARPGRRNDDDITLFESQGMAIQDLVLAARVLEKAGAAGIGTELPY
ncbi:MAG: ornithine cyclodeaminase family protein [Gammaproteobacteria bacterium]|jgi:alanine dehydrogenase|nr:ornithine cyclodeaminase family protein [Gammaproteobacteria bacterium]MBU0770407.1 ornithine cyclodeaminase family protein [Gammaproteobacteria bacterium]MBU0855135.1 ornithine cyclodeaminase family protein [Gammaproteobacteria bacterium]MBU1847325.1 ornithine cyclodeaminase family protein [Gammaproteobacteria bacterium]